MRCPATNRQVPFPFSIRRLLMYKMISYYSYSTLLSLVILIVSFSYILVMDFVRITQAVNPWFRYPLFRSQPLEPTQRFHQ